jgi:hypothetical protein
MIGRTFYHWLSLLITILCIHQQSKLHSGHYPRTDPFQVKDVGSLVAKDLATHFAAIHNELAFQLYEAHDHYKDCADGNRKIHPNFHIRDQAWLLRRNIQTKLPSRKLDYQ